MSKKLTTEEFITRAREVHGDKYDYSAVEYINIDTNIKILCNKHKEYFLQTPYDHTANRAGCPLCAGNKKLSTEEFIARAIKIHNNMYDYSIATYTGTHSKVDIICPTHGVFSQNASSHLKGIGCPKCAYEKYGKSKRTLQEDFIKRAIEIHGDSLDFGESLYTHSAAKVIVTCNKHGSKFLIKASHLLSGHGCPSCAKTGFSPEKDGVVYVLRSGDYIKVGISNKSGEYRANMVSRSADQRFNVVQEITLNGADCVIIEQKLLKWLCSEYKNPTRKFDGYTECFIGVPVTDVVNRLHQEIDNLYK